MPTPDGNATEQDMLDALEKGYIRDWRIKPPITDKGIQLNMLIESMYDTLGGGVPRHSCFREILL